jgi:Protein of unknown function (DUF3563)
MKATNLPFPEHSFIGSCIKLAQSTFFDLLPSNVEGKGPTAPAVLPAPLRAPLAASYPANWISALDAWFHKHSMQEREAYLAQSTDIFDLESRIRTLERRPYY